MVDILAFSTHELVSRPFTRLLEALSCFLESKTGTSTFSFSRDFPEVWVLLDAEEQGVVHKVELTKHLSISQHSIHDVFVVFLFKVQPEVLRVHVYQVHVLQSGLRVRNLSFDYSFDCRALEIEYS